METSEREQLPTASEILKESWAIYRKKFSILTFITLIGTVATWVGAVLLVIGAFSFAFNEKNISDEQFIFNHNYSLIILAITALLIIIVFQMWQQIALMEAIAKSTYKTAFEAFRKSFSKLWPFFIVSLWILLYVLPGIILFVIPGILFALWYSQAVYFVILEDKEPREALKMSKELMNGRVWEVIGKFLFLGLIVLVFNVIVSLLSELGGSKATADIISFIVNLFTIPFSAVYSYQVFKHLKSMH